jgi:hypothetical protein
LLDEYKLSNNASKVILVQNYINPFGDRIFQQFKDLNFQTTTFPSVFRPSPLVEKLNPTSPVQVPVNTAIQSGGSTPAQRTSSWANVGGPGTEGKVFNVAPTINNKTEVKKVYFNEMHQHLDQPLPQVDPSAMLRINNKIKLDGNFCNEYHLNGKCHNYDYCEYNHGERLQGQEQLALRVKARNRPCKKGLECLHPSCFSGHHCPQNVCRYTECYFMDTHGMDKVRAFQFLVYTITHLFTDPENDHG